MAFGDGGPALSRCFGLGVERDFNSQDCEQRACLAEWSEDDLMQSPGIRVKDAASRAHLRPTESESVKGAPGICIITKAPGGSHTPVYFRSTDLWGKPGGGHVVPDHRRP